MKEYLKQFEIKGFKSIKDQTVTLQPDLNVLIGANASGKSNFIESFVFIRHVVDKQLERYVVEHGGAAQLMHYGGVGDSVVESVNDISGATGRQDSIL